MSELILNTEYAGKAARLLCSGRLVAGAACQELDAALEQLRLEGEHVDLDLEHLIFLDSSGIGALVRNLVLARKDGKTLQITSMSPQVRSALTITNVISQFNSSVPAAGGTLKGVRILFAHPSAEVRTFVGAVLKDRGAITQSCASLYDVKSLVGRDSIDLVILPAEFDTSTLPPSAPRLLRLKKDAFSNSGEEAAESLLQQIRSVIAAG